MGKGFIVDPVQGVHHTIEGTFALQKQTRHLIAEALLTQQPPSQEPLSPALELLIIEGFKELTGYPRIEVVREGRPMTAPHPSDILCVATDLENMETFAPVYHLDDIDDIAALIRRELLESKPSETSE